MSLEASPLAAAVPGLVRSDPHGRGITRVREEGGFRYLDPSGNRITDAATLDRIQALRIPPAWADVWTLRKQHVRFTRDGIMFDYVAKWGKQRTIVIRDNLVQPTIRALARVDNDLDTLWSYEQDGRWHSLHSRDVGNYIATRAGGHFTAKEFRTWNATVLMALALANAGPSSTPPGRKRTIAAGVRAVADWLGDTAAVARSSYIDPRLIARYESDGHLPSVPPGPIALPATPEAETAVAALLAISADPAPGQPGWPGLSRALPARTHSVAQAVRCIRDVSAETLTRLRRVRSRRRVRIQAFHGLAGDLGDEVEVLIEVTAWSARPRAGLHRPAGGRAYAGSAREHGSGPPVAQPTPRPAARRPRGLNMAS